MSSSKHVQVQMIDSLAAVPACIDDYAEAAGRVLFADFCRTVEQVAEDPGVHLLDMGQ